MYKFILWDHDGVLVDTEYWYFLSTQRALSELGVGLEQRVYMRYMVKGLACWELAVQQGIGAEQIEAKRQDRNRYYQESLRCEDIEIPGVVEVLRELAETHRMAIVTTSKAADFLLIHRKRDITACMEFVLTREDYDRSKPDPEPYLLALERFGAAASDTLVVEDSQRGLQSALAAGLDCAIVHSTFTASHDFTGARYRVNNLAELLPLLCHPPELSG